MRKEFIKRALIGAPIGVLICQIISIVVSYGINNGSYYAVAPGLTELCGSVTNAVTVQTVCVLVYGGVMAGISVIWDNERWSLLRQTVTHLIICSAATLPIAYFMHWIEQSVWGVLSYYAMFVVTYFFIWLGSYISIRKRVRQMNERMNQMKTEK